MTVGRTRQLVLVTGLSAFIVGALLFQVVFSNHIGHMPQPPPGGYTDEAITAALIEGVARHYPDAGAQIAKSATGGPDLYVKNRVAFVGTLVPSRADSLCATIAGMYDPESGWALPLTGAIVMSGGRSVATCARDAVPGQRPSAGLPGG